MTVPSATPHRGRARWYPVHRLQFLTAVGFKAETEKADLILHLGDDVVGCGFEACDQNGKLRYIFTKNGKLVGE